MVKQEIKTGYKETDFGIFPVDWEVKDLNGVSKIVDSLHQTPSFVDYGFAMVRATEIKTGNLNLEKSTRVDKKTYVEFIRNYQPKKGDIVLGRVGTYVGVTSFVDTDEPFCMGQNTLIIQPLIVGKFLYYVLNSEKVREQIKNESFGTSGQKSLSLKNVKELKLPVPSESAEQSYIAHVLSDSDNLIESLEKVIEKKKNIKRGAMKELLTGKKRLLGGWETKKVKLTNIGVIPDDWEVKSIGSVCQIFGRIGFRGYTKKDIVGKEQGVISISPSNIIDDKMDFSNCTYISWFKYEESPEIKISNGDILLVKTGSTFGKTAIIKNLNGEATINPQLIVLKNIIVDKLYLSYMMSFHIIQNQISGAIVGGAIPTLSQQEISNFKFPIPATKTEQSAIAQVLFQIDSEIERLVQKRDKYRQLKVGLMQQLLTGRIRLKWQN